MDNTQFYIFGGLTIGLVGLAFVYRSKDKKVPNVAVEIAERVFPKVLEEMKKEPETETKAEA